MEGIGFRIDLKAGVMVIMKGAKKHSMFIGL